MFKRTYGSGLSATIICASLVLSACGGGGGSGGSSSSGGDASTLKDGLYEADIRYVNGTSSQTAVTYLSPTGEFSIVFGGSAGVSIGKLAFDSTRISGISSDYRQLGETTNPEGFVEDKGTQEGTINGTITSQGSATFSTTDAAGQVNTNVTLQRQNLISDVGISLSRASGTYVKGESEVALTLGADGSLDAQYYTQTTGCQLVGIEALSVPDASINVFDITYTMSNCTNDNRNGEYSGVGYFIPMKDQQMRVVFATHNGKVAMHFTGTK